MALIKCIFLGIEFAVTLDKATKVLHKHYTANISKEISFILVLEGF